MKKDDLQRRNPRTGRLQAAKQRLIDILDEVDLWLDEARDDTFVEELFDFSLRAAELAATLGFGRPPFEHLALVPMEDWAAFQDVRERARYTRVCFNTPDGDAGSCLFGFEGELTGVLISQSNIRLHSDLRSRLRRWKRAVVRLDAGKAGPAHVSLAVGRATFEAIVFEDQRTGELAGSTSSSFDEAMKGVGEAQRLAWIHGLSPVQTSELCRAFGRDAAQRGLAVPQNSADSTPPSSCVDASQLVSTPNAERGFESKASLRERAEDHVKRLCGGKFPGVRKLAGALGCESRVSSLSNAIKSSTYLTARLAEYKAERKAQPRDQGLTEVHMDRIAQSTEPDPAETLDELIDEQTADMRNDDRRAQPRSQARSS